MQDRINQVDKTSCTARPDHTVGSGTAVLILFAYGPVFHRQQPYPLHRRELALGVGHNRLLRISPREELESPAAGR
jgi:hypothetical protein